jgi:hypothetical protein
VAVGPILGGAAAAAVVLISDQYGILGAAVFAGLGSVAGWGLQTLFARRHKGVPAVLTILAIVGGFVAWGTLPLKDGSATSGSTMPTSDAPLAIPDHTRSFEAVPADQTPPDLDGLVALAHSSYGDPQRLIVRHMYYDADPFDGSTASVAAFTGATAIALAEVEWEWFAAGNSGNLRTAVEVSGDVRCTFHPQPSGDIVHAECWRWDTRLAVVVSGIKVRDGATHLVAPAVEDLFARVAESY